MSQDDHSERIVHAHSSRLRPAHVRAVELGHVNIPIACCPPSNVSPEPEERAWCRQKGRLQKNPPRRRREYHVTASRDFRDQDGMCKICCIGITLVGTDMRARSGLQ